MSNQTNTPTQERARRPFQLTAWSNLTYPQKFTGVAFIFALSLLAFLPLILEQNTRIENYGRKEAQGTIYLRFAWQLTRDLDALHLASIERENETGSDLNVSEALVAVEADMIALESATPQYAVPLGQDVNLQEIKTRWSSLRNAIQNRSSNEIETGFTTLTNSLDALVKETGDKSYLILDPDLDTYYVMDTVLLNMPENQALTFQIWQIANEAAQTNELSIEKLSEISVLISQLQSNLRSLDQNLQTSIENNENGEIAELLSVPAQNYLAATQSFINLNNTYFSEAQAIQLSPIILKASYRGVNESSDIFYAAASDTLEKGIQTRIQVLTLRLSVSIMLATLSILIAFLIGLRVMRTISLPLFELLAATQKLTTGGLSTRIQSISQDEAGQVAQAFNTLAEELQNSRISLQSRANELERRTTELETIAEVARDISIIRDLNTMLNLAASQIYEKFNFYHIGIYLVDERGEYAILRAANGHSASELLEKNHKVKIGTASIVGSVAQTGQAQIALFSENDSLVSKNIQLPETKSEIGLPLRGKSLTIGILNIHSKINNAFTKRELQIFQILTDQLAAAIDNAQLVEQIGITNTELNTANRIQTKRNWENKSLQESLAYEYDGLRVQPVPKNLPTELSSQLENGKPIVLQQGIINEYTGKPAQNTLMVPLMLAGQIIGVIGLERENSDMNWSDEEISIAEAVANRAAITLENARLLEESQRRASKERTISEATARISTALSVENILGITAEELERVIGDSEVILQIKTDEKSSVNE